MNAVPNAVSTFIGNVTSDIIQPIIFLLFALALFLFVNGLILFFDLRGSDPKERERGRRLLMWGIVGFFIMTFGLSIISAITKTFCGTAFCANVTNNANPSTITVPTSTFQQ